MYIPKEMLPPGKLNNNGMEKETLPPLLRELHGLSLVRVFSVASPLDLGWRDRNSLHHGV